jgi:beta-lactamase superfamily II metal-dependent hydrolase
MLTASAEPKQFRARLGSTIRPTNPNTTVWDSFGDGGAVTDVIGPPPGEDFSEIKDNSVVILLNYGTARVLLAGEPKAKEENRRAAPIRVLKPFSR